MHNKVKVSKKRVVRIDSELWHTSWCLLKAGQERELGCAHQFRGSLIFTAFAFEAYLNHIGPFLIKVWPSIERRLAPIEKLALLFEHKQQSIDWGARPWQTLKKLFQFRNTLAHGRSESLIDDYPDTTEHYLKKFYEMPQAEWERFASKEMALRAREDVMQACDLLHKLGGRLEDLPFFPGSASGSARAA